MPLSLAIGELLGYTSGERDKWEQWFQAQPAGAVDAPVQREGRFLDVWALMDHIFLVERRHTQRLRQLLPLAEQTGVARPDTAALFQFGRDARHDFEDFLRTAPQQDLTRTIEVKFGREMRFTARKLAFHILIHEVRHWAQIALALRCAGFAPPGEHDLIFASAME